MNETELAKAIDPFRRVIAIIDALPQGHVPGDGEPLRNVLPGVWPTLGDLRTLVKAVKGAL